MQGWSDVLAPCTPCPTFVLRAITNGRAGAPLQFEDRVTGLRSKTAQVWQRLARERKGQRLERIRGGTLSNVTRIGTCSRPAERSKRTASIVGQRVAKQSLRVNGYTDTV
jgi:hypothetical protein